MNTTNKSFMQLRAEKLFRRRPTTPWDRSELVAWKVAESILYDLPESEWQALEIFYAADQNQTYARKNLSTMLNNLNGEISKAIAWCQRTGQMPASQPTSIKIGQFTFAVDNPPTREQCGENWLRYLSEFKRLGGKVE